VKKCCGGENGEDWPVAGVRENLKSAEQMSVVLHAEVDTKH
jgi:hypothetical protein